MKSYIQLANIANTYYDIWTDDGIDTFHADVDEITAWLKREDLYTSADAEIADLTDDEIEQIAGIISEKVREDLPAAKHWYYIEDCTSSRSEVYDEILPAESKEEALTLASAKWEALTESDRRKRDEAYSGYAAVDEYGCVDYDTMTEIVYLKGRT